MFNKTSSKVSTQKILKIVVIIPMKICSYISIWINTLIHPFITLHLNVYNCFFFLAVSFWILLHGHYFNNRKFRKGKEEGITNITITFSMHVLNNLVFRIYCKLYYITCNLHSNLNMVFPSLLNKHCIKIVLMVS